MAAFSFKVEGLNRLQKKLDSLPKTLVSEVSGELEDGANAIRNGALRDVPVDTGLLKSSISVKPITKLSFEVVVQKEYAPFVEFGTGTLVKVPSGLESYAMQFKGRGMKHVNLPARPFLFNNYLRERPEIIKRLKEIISDL